MGMDFINVQLIADQFAANGYFAVVPDLFNGNVVPINPPEGFDLMKWVQEEMPQVPKVDPIIENVIKHLRGELGVKRLGGVGYCFGGKYVCRWLKEGSLDVGYTAHPSWISVEELQAIKGPLSIAAAGKCITCAKISSSVVIWPGDRFLILQGCYYNSGTDAILETDQIFSAEKRRESEDILQKMDVPYQINLFSDVSHGFAVRADLSKKPVKFAKEQAFLQAVSWFEEYLKN